MSLSPEQKSDILLEALPWLQRFSGQRVVIKYGGNAMINDDLKRAFAQDVQFLRQVGLYPIVVHGGGPQISDMLKRLGVESEFRGGLRVTTPEVRDIAQMVLIGQVQRELISLINEVRPYAVGISGQDGGLMRAKRRTAIVNGEHVDVGLVGEVVEVKTEAIDDLLAAGRIPVISTLAPDDEHEILNINADTAAGAIAMACGAYKLVMMTDVAGLYRDWPDPESLASEITLSEVEELLPSLESGMRPKMEACIAALHGGVTQAHVIDGRIPHALLIEIFTDKGSGTAINGDGFEHSVSKVPLSQLRWNPPGVQG
ncbi:N-acetylglutamate kinase [Ruaniaceae bacterium KH17]|nr:N-acetylglutamate kinase [Ruaniaceae bacterium KH17]